MEIRKYNSNDFERVVDILKDSFPEASIGISNTLNDLSSLELDNKRHFQLVAVEKDNVVGYVLITRCNDPIIGRVNFWIDYVCVDSNYRGRGIAKLLLTKVEELAKEENVLYLQLTSNRSRTIARKIYLDLGFEIRESDIFRKVM